MIILHIISSLAPEIGGPAEGLKQLSSALVNLSQTVEIITLEENPDLSTVDNKVNVISLGPSIGKYRLNFKLIPFLIKNSNKYDVIICQGIWQFHSFATFIAYLFKRFPYFVFVHGALDPWFRYTYPLKHVKKWLYWPWAEYNVLKCAKGVLFTTEEEKILAVQSFFLYHVNPFVVNYGIKEPVFNELSSIKIFLKHHPELENKKIILFMSRIHKKKGADLLIKAFSKIFKNKTDYQLVVAGPCEDNEINMLKEIANACGISKRISWVGMLKGEMKWGAICSADLFVLPSHSENFGVVIAESLACKTPVLISRKVNIWREVERYNAGLICDDNSESLSTALAKWIELDESTIETMSNNSSRCFHECFEISSGAKNFIRMLQEEIK